jgi:hypothetical protein
MAARYLQKVKSASTSATHAVVKKVKVVTTEKKEEAADSLLIDRDDMNEKPRVTWSDQIPAKTNDIVTHNSESVLPTHEAESPHQDHTNSEDNGNENNSTEENVQGNPLSVSGGGSASKREKAKSLKAISSGISSFSKIVAEKAAEGGKTVSKSASAVVAVSKSASAVIAEKAAEGTKTMVSATKVAGKTVAAATKNASDTIQEQMRKTGVIGEEKIVSSSSIPPIEEEVTNPAMFGIPLEQTVLSEDGSVVGQIPIIISEIITVILDRQWYLEEGLFRLSTNLHHMNALKRSYNLRQIVDYSDVLDPHLPACTLKLFLRELPESLFTNALQDQWNTVINSNSKQEDKKTKVKELLDQLPTINSRSIEEIFCLLNLVAEYKEVNKMTEKNLGIIFVPALGLNSPELFHFMVEECNDLFSKNSLVNVWRANGGPSRPPVTPNPLPPPSDIPLPPSDIPLPPSDIPHPPSDISERSVSRTDYSSEDASDSVGLSLPIRRTESNKNLSWASTTPRSGSETNLSKKISNPSLQVGSAAFSMSHSATSPTAADSKTRHAAGSQLSSSENTGPKTPLSWVQSSRNPHNQTVPTPPSWPPVRRTTTKRTNESAVNEKPGIPQKRNTFPNDEQEVQPKRNTFPNDEPPLTPSVEPENTSEKL